jgi:hypothetical protein
MQIFKTKDGDAQWIEGVNFKAGLYMTEDEELIKRLNANQYVENITVIVEPKPVEPITEPKQKKGK